MPYSIACDPMGTIQGPRANKFDISWSIISLSTYLFATVASYQYMEHYNDALNILVLCDNFHLTLGLSFGVLLIVSDMCNRFKFVDLLNKFNIFDKEVIAMRDSYTIY